MYDASMKIKDFWTESYFDQYEFSVRYQLCNSDCESISVGELLTFSGSSAEEFNQLNLGYTPASGDLLLRDNIAAQYSDIVADDVVVLGSPVEGIFLAAHALLEKGDEVIVMTPAYDALLNVFEFVVGNENVKNWNLDKCSQGWQPSLADLETLITPRTKLLVTNFPHNPTGYLPTLSFQKELCELVRETGVTLFCDEMYFGLVHAPAVEIPPINNVLPEAISLCGLSKTLGLPGLRSGWLIVKNEKLRRQLVNWKHYTSLCPSAPSQFLANLALKALPQIKNRNLGIIQQNLNFADEFFRKHSDSFQWNRPSGGSTALVQWKVPSVSELAHELAAKNEILILPTLGLGMDDHHFRIGLGRKGFEKALSKFDEWLTKNDIA